MGDAETNHVVIEMKTIPFKKEVHVNHVANNRVVPYMVTTDNRYACCESRREFCVLTLTLVIIFCVCLILGLPLMVQNLEKLTNYSL